VRVRVEVMSSTSLSVYRKRILNRHFGIFRAGAGFFGIFRAAPNNQPTHDDILGTLRTVRVNIMISTYEVCLSVVAW
jgi:hypothetical protein